MREWISKGVLAGALLCVLALTVAARLGLVELAWVRPDGHFFWYLSRATGTTATVALTLEVVCGLFVSTAGADRLLPRARSVEIHRWLASVTLSLLAVHALALLGDRYVAFDALDVLLPFVSPYRPLAVGLGVIAAHAAVLTHASFFLRQKLGPAGFRRVHLLAYPALFLGLVHALSAGTDAGAPWLRGIIAACGGLVLWWTVYRVMGVAGRAGVGVLR
jgi:predicted ferric reductase